MTRAADGIAIQVNGNCPGNVPALEPRRSVSPVPVLAHESLFGSHWRSRP